MNDFFVGLLKEGLSGKGERTQMTFKVSPFLRDDVLTLGQEIMVKYLLCPASDGRTAATCPSISETYLRRGSRSSKLSYGPRVGLSCRWRLPSVCRGDCLAACDPQRGYSWTRVLRIGSLIYFFHQIGLNLIEIQLIIQE